MSSAVSLDQNLSSGAPIEVSVVLPCLNEAETLELCIVKAKTCLQALGVQHEIIVADNGSTDGSLLIAKKNNARIVHVEQKGYGSALLAGIKAATGEYVIMGDADDSYDFSALEPFIKNLREGYDLVMGNRFKGGIAKGAMPFLNRYLGNPVLTSVGKLFFKSVCSDFHCGLRGFRRDSILALDLRTTGMEFASEMIVKVSLHQMKVSEVPTTLRPDGRSRGPHLKPWQDGWRHLRFLLLYSPNWLFLYPGAFLFFGGITVGLWLAQGPRPIGSVTFDVHTLLYAMSAVIIGFQAMVFALCTKIFAVSEGLLPLSLRWQTLLQKIKLETGIIVGVVIFIVGIVGSISALSQWGGARFGPIEPTGLFRIILPSATCMIVGCQTILSSFFVSVLFLRRT